MDDQTSDNCGENKSSESKAESDECNGNDSEESSHTCEDNQQSEKRGLI